MIALVHRWTDHAESRPLRVGVLIVLLSLAVRLALTVALDLHHQPFRGELQRIAESLVERGVYGNPYAVETGPTAHASPLYTLATAAVFSIFGTGPAGELALYLLAILLASTLYGLLPSFSRLAGMGTLPGLLAGLFGALVPFHFLNESRAGDAPLSALMLMGILASALAAQSNPRPPWRLSLAAGLTWGLSLLLLPTVLPFLLILTLLALAFRRTGPFVRRLAVALLICGLCLAPWVLRNTAVFGEPVWFRSNFGLELRLAHNAEAEADIDSNRESGSFDRFHPFVSEEAALELRKVGELEYHRRMLDEALDWIRGHPASAARLTALRVCYFWFPKTLKPAQSVLLSLLTLGGAAGLVLLGRRNPPSALLLGSLLATFPVVYYLIQSAVRYRYPVNWTLLLLTAYALTRWIGASRSRQRMPGPPG